MMNEVLHCNRAAEEAPHVDHAPRRGEGHGGHAVGVAAQCHAVGAEGLGAIWEEF